MKIEQIYTGCLSQGSYYITANGEAAIIDPIREIEPYLDRIKKDGVKLKYIFETHFHADFVSGHLDLSKKTGAPIVFGPNANPSFAHISATDGQVFKLGDVEIKLIHTPGHTMESSSYLLKDENGKDQALFSGDTLFLGDVGRPDLAQKSADMTQEDLAGLLYDSLYQKILPLADDITVYPAHGAGSACGKNMMKETVDSLGNQKKMNYALNQPNKESFIAEVTDGLLPPPGYFPMNVAMNKRGYEEFDKVLLEAKKAIPVNDLISIADLHNAIILDTRSNAAFSKGFVPSSINIGLDGSFAPWVGELLKDVKQSIVIVSEEDKIEESITRLARVGFDNVIGYLEGGFDAWRKANQVVASINRITATRFNAEFQEGKSTVIDVRKESEYQAEHVVSAINKPLSEIYEWAESLNKNESFYLHCAGGYRSMIAASILLAKGITNFKEVEGGFAAISQTDLPRTAYVCPSTLAKA